MSKLAISIYLNPFRLTRKLENFGCLEMSKQFIVSIILHNVAVAAIAVRLAVITAHVVIIVVIKHAPSCEKMFDMRVFSFGQHIIAFVQPRKVFVSSLKKTSVIVTLRCIARHCWGSCHSTMLPKINTYYL